MLRYFAALAILLISANPAAASSCEARIGGALDALTRGNDDLATKNFDAPLLRAHDATNLRLVWASLKEQGGDFRARGASAWHMVEGRRYLFTPMAFAKGAFEALDACDHAGRIVFFEWGPVSAAATKIAGATSHTEPDGLREYPATLPSAWGPLPATLTMPAGAGPFAAVLLVAGAGRNDQDESIGPNKPFRDLALGLARSGIASLRYDKSITAYPSQAGLSARLTVDDEVTDDAVTGLKMLAATNHVDPHRVFVFGHSLGGMMAPRIALREQNIAGVIMAGAPAESILANGIQQTEYLATVQHIAQDTLQQQLKSLRDEQALLARHMTRPLPAAGYQGMPQSWWMSLYVYDQVAAARALTVPMLLVQGGGDFQVQPRYNFAIWQRAFAHDPRVTLIEYPGLSHVFMQAGTPPSPDDYAKPAHVDARVIADVAQWIKAQPARP